MMKHNTQSGVRPRTRARISSGKKCSFSQRDSWQEPLATRVHTLLSIEAQFFWKARTWWRHHVWRACACHIWCCRRHLASPYLCRGGYHACIKVISSMRGFPRRQVSIQTLGFLVGKQAKKNLDEKIESRISIFLVEILGRFPGEKPESLVQTLGLLGKKALPVFLLVLAEKTKRVYEA